LAAAGVSPLDVIRIATFNSAIFLGKADQLGSIDVGKIADLVLLSKDPAADINNTKSIVFVMKAARSSTRASCHLPEASRRGVSRYEPFTD
jgi:imidazolonepropionase-like amidohydrolase